jgi:hypothetical protein
MNNEQPNWGTKRHYHVFDRKQILAGDVGAFSRQYSPIRLTGGQLRLLFGSVSLVIARGENDGEVFANPESRRFIQLLHQRCPWLGFFLWHEASLGYPSPLGRFPFLGLALCVSDFRLWTSDLTGMIKVQANRHQIGVFERQLIYGLHHLGRRAGLPFRVIAYRELEIQSQLGLAAPGAAAFEAK